MTATPSTFFYVGPGCRSIKLSGNQSSVFSVCGVGWGWDREVMFSIFLFPQATVIILPPPPRDARHYSGVQGIPSSQNNAPTRGLANIIDLNCISGSHRANIFKTFRDKALSLGRAHEPWYWRRIIFWSSPEVIRRVKLGVCWKGGSEQEGVGMKNAEGKGEGNPRVGLFVCRVSIKVSEDHRWFSLFLPILKIRDLLPPTNVYKCLVIYS